jgi:DNA-directed RNA polymerase subunit RPC12/RpoP
MEEPIIRCPHCGSQQLSVGEKGFSAGKAIVGTLLTNMAGGILFGLLGSGKTKVTCLNCGKTMNVSELEKIYPNQKDKDGFPPVI